MADAIQAMRDAFTQLANGLVTLPLRQCLNATTVPGVDLVMPCHSAASNVFSLKTVTVFPDNTQQGLPVIQGLVVLTDATTGSHLAILDGSSLTALRTGAVSGLATDILARADASRAAIFGGGVQARTQLEAISCVRKIQKATVYSLGQAATERFAAEMTDQLGFMVQRVDTPAANVAGADIICTATSSSEPVFPDSALPPGVHINAVGTFRPDTAEIPAATVCRANVVVDHRESAEEEAGDLLQPLRAGLIQPEHIATQLGDVLLHRAPGRDSAKEITLFKSVGVAIQDLCAATRALENAQRLGLGISLSPRGVQ